MNNCKNCAWYCHSDGHCYGSETALVYGPNPLSFVHRGEERQCRRWAFDGLEDWEREEYDEKN